MNRNYAAILEPIVKGLKDISNLYIDPRVRAIMVTKLEEVQLWAPRLYIKDNIEDDGN